MKEPKVSELKKYLNGLIKLNKKYVTSDRLSKYVGVYPEIINENLSYFEPTLGLDPEFNLMELVPAIKKFIIDKEENRGPAVNKAPAVKKSQVEQYESINDFVYRKMSMGGLLDRNVVLSDTDLRILKKLIAQEQADRKDKNKKR